MSILNTLTVSALSDLVSEEEIQKHLREEAVSRIASRKYAVNFLSSLEKAPNEGLLTDIVVNELTYDREIKGVQDHSEEFGYKYLLEGRSRFRDIGVRAYLGEARIWVSSLAANGVQFYTENDPDFQRDFPSLSTALYRELNPEPEPVPEPMPELVVEEDGLPEIEGEMRKKSEPELEPEPEIKRSRFEIALS